ncbi:MAG: type III-B CRISPR module RAMP protein Cmr6, partial [Myxococcales bacterium]|nr:type III-B CRISPR module RAMP protein Cmr6 [Myxococcales bacterium]
MRSVLENLGRPAHVGLAYDVWATFAASGQEAGKIGDHAKGKWLAGVRGIPIDPDYAQAFERWRRGFDDEGLVQEVETSGRLLVGHGNPSVVDVGLTVHHTWGVPVIPGSALEGVLASYVAREVGGTDDEGDPIRRKLRGPRWERGVMVEPPGELYAALFGMPEVAGGDGVEAGGGRRGAVCFHDALLVPEGRVLPLARDVITVHQKPYYDG